MGKPVWIDPPPGSLGIIPAGIYYQIPLLVENANTGNSAGINYQLVAGTLPKGMQIAADGLIIGVPSAVEVIEGVPAPVSRDVTNKFVVRAYTTQTVGNVTVVDRVADRTFELTIDGQNAPHFTTPPGQIAQYIDGAQVNDLQINYTGSDAVGLPTIVKLNSGALPPGLTLSSTGKISGYIIPNTTLSATPGWSIPNQGWSQYGWSFAAVSASTNYPFTLEVTNGQNSDLRSFSIQVYSRNTFTADNTAIKADDTFITADVTTTQTPIIITPTGSISNALSDNYFAFQFQAIDFNGGRVQYELYSGSFPAGLTLDPNSGWLYGYIPGGYLAEIGYSFSIRTYLVSDPTIVSVPYAYTMTVSGPISTDITWLTPVDLGNIDNGATSIFYVQAVNRDGLQLQYRLASGSDSRLPQGLQLLPSGNIAGRVSFDTFALDGGNTVFDVPNTTNIGPNSTETTFDLTYTFTVNAYSTNGVVNVNRTFTIHVVRKYNEPYDNLYIQAMPPLDDRALLASLLQNSDIFTPNLIYRADDPNFGVATKVVYNHAYGLTASTLDSYVNALELNHYWKNLVLGQIKTARATDGAGNVIYEVVYSEVVDNLVNNSGVSVGKEVTLPYEVDGDIRTVYPNSLYDMRTQVIDSVGQVSNILPQWMISKQADGNILGFTPAWVIAYTKPGESGQIAYNIQQQFGTKLNLVDFTADRYEIDKLLTHNWDPVTQHWIPYPPVDTTFDTESHYQLNNNVIPGAGTGYRAGDRIRILGSLLGGQNGINDAIITVNTVNVSTGAIEGAFCGSANVADTALEGTIFYGVSGTNITGTGVGATWNILISNNVPTIFDGGSLQFIAPEDMYSSTDAYNKYVLYPKRNILG